MAIVQKLVLGIASVSFFLSGPLEAHSLKAYRKVLGTDPGMSKTALDRVTGIRKRLKSKAPVFDGLKTEVFTTPDADRGKKTTATTGFKELVLGVADQLREHELRDRPLEFDPSLFRQEQEAKMETERLNFCLKNASDKFPLVLEDLAGRVQEFQERQKVEALEAFGRIKKIQDQRIALIQDYLTKHAPKSDSGASLKDILGEATDLNFVEGHVTRLTFSKKVGEYTVFVPMTLSMLISMRTELDFYFIEILKCFSGFVANTAFKENPRQETLLAAKQIVMPELMGLIKGAEDVHTALAKLSKKQMDFLIDFFFQLRGEDIPTEAEMVSGSPEEATKENRPSVLIYIAETTTKFAKDPNRKALLSMILDDARFYRNLNQELYQLGNYLEEETAYDTEKAKLIESLKKKKAERGKK